MAIQVFVDGAAGTTGLEIVARLEAHPEFEPLVLDDARRKDAGARREALIRSRCPRMCQMRC